MARLSDFEKRHGGWSAHAVAIMATLALLLWCTGVVLYLWPAEDALQLSTVQAAARRFALVTHGVGAWVFCLVAGRWLWPHAQLVWRRARGSTWLLGLCAGAVVAVVAVSGLLLLYGPGDTHDPAASLHWWSAVGWPLLLGMHGWRVVLPKQPPR